MALEAPYLPQAVNNVIAGLLIHQINGIQINVKYYSNAAYGDTIRFYWGNGLIGFISVPSNLQFPLIHIIPASLVANGTFTLSYSVEDEAENIVLSPVIEVTITGHLTPRMSISAQVLTNNVLANGVSKNHIRYTVATHTQETGSSEDFIALNANKLIDISGPEDSVFSPVPYQTNQHGFFDLGIASQSWGVKVIQARLEDASNQPNVGATINFSVNYRFGIHSVRLNDPVNTNSLIVTFRVVITLYNNTTNQGVPGELLLIKGLEDEFQSSGVTQSDGSLTVDISRDDFSGAPVRYYQVTLARDSAIYQTFSLNIR